MKKNTILIEMHQLVNYGPALLNRDESGNIKEITINGTRRARISSQCYKAAMRNIGDTDIIHTRRIYKIIEDRLAAVKQENGERKYSDKYINNAINFVRGLFGKLKDNKDKTEQITPQVISYSKVNDIDDIVDYITEHFKTEEDLDAVFTKAGSRSSVVNTNEFKEFKKNREMKKVGKEIALFGRMVVEDVCKSVESSVCMNHAYSINALNGDVDFFTAVEEYVLQDEAMEAAMMDTVDVDSSCFYRYMSVDLNTFMKNLAIGENVADENVYDSLKEIAADSVSDLLERFLHVAPNAKQHSNATCPKPSMTYIRITKNGYPCSMDDEFHEAIFKKANKSITEQGIEKMVAFIEDEVYEAHGLVDEMVIVKADRQHLIPETLTKVNEKTAKETIKKILMEQL